MDTSTANEPKFSIYSVACAIQLNRSDTVNLINRKLSGPAKKIQSAINELVTQQRVLVGENGKVTLNVVQKEATTFLFVFYCKEEHTQYIVDHLGKVMELEIHTKRAKVFVAPASVEKSENN